MRLRESYRVPLLLLSCLVTALVFPRACAESRVGWGALLPATAPLTGAETRDADAALREENARLAHDNARLEEELEARPVGAVGPLANLRVVRTPPPRQVGVTARVRARDASSSRRSFLIDVGRAEKVVPGLAVTFGGSLVGIVSAASEHAARVVRIDDPTAASTVPARVLGARASAAPRGPDGVARGSGDGEVCVSLLRQGDAVVGDMVVTGVARPGAAGDADADIPEGLVIGEVVQFGDQNRDGSYEAYVRPLRDLDTLNSVLVLLSDGRAGRALGSGAKK
jgi:hypothetical protein